MKQYLKEHKQVADTIELKIRELTLTGVNAAPIQNTDAEDDLAFDLDE